MLKLLGLIEPDVDLRSISASVFGEGVAGYYDPRSKRLRIVSGTTPDALSEMVLAHELTHALEDQRFGLALEEGESDDAALARLALVEGSAMLVMQQYLLRHIGAEQALSGAARLGPADRARPAEVPRGPADLPLPGRARSSSRRCSAQGGGSWKLVDLADRVRVPESTEQVLHPEKWVEVESAAARCGSTSQLGADWRRVARGTWGEWQTRELLDGNGDAAAAGWGGDRYELWQRGACAAPPCRDDRRAGDEVALGQRAATRASSRPRCARPRSRAVPPWSRAGDTVTFVLARRRGARAPRRRQPA